MPTTTTPSSMEQRYYTGIGSRRTPQHVLTEMRRIARELAWGGWTLRSGGADGADSAFEEGALEAGGDVEIYLPWPKFNERKGGIVMGNHPEAMRLAAALHPAWDRLSFGARKLHTRNVGQALGRDLASPSAFVICWTPDGCVDERSRTRETGGTATAIVVAGRRGIPVFNLEAGTEPCLRAIREVVSRFDRRQDDEESKVLEER